MLKHMLAVYHSFLRYFLLRLKLLLLRMTFSSEIHCFVESCLCLAVEMHLLASQCWAKSRDVRRCLSVLLFSIDHSSSSIKDQILSQHFADSCDTWWVCRTISSQKLKRNKCPKQARDKISHDKADQCKAEGLPAAVCKPVIVLSGPSH